MKAKSVFSAPARTAPLFCQYDGQCQPQRAFIELDLSTGYVDADYSSQIGSGVPVAVWRGVVLRWPIRRDLSTEQITKVIDGALPLLQQVLDGAEIEADEGSWLGSLDESASVASHVLEEYFSLIDYESEVITDLAGWLTGDDISLWLPKEDDDIVGFIVDTAESIESDGWIIAEESGTVEEILLDLWAEHLYAGYPLPSNVAQFLINTSFCADSQWMHELECYARGGDA